MNRCLLSLLLLVLLCSGCQAQQPKPVAKSASADKPHQVEYVAVSPDQCPKDYFRHPLALPVSLTGTFAEVRSNHYHSGIDLRIGGRVGAPVYAAQEGYVSRICISPWGGGKALYIDHPNGYRTVYMHLNDYVGDIAAFVRDYQYQHECFAFDVSVPPGRLPVGKGTLVAHAGNTGSSGGPHLHYEIRLSATDQTINPLYFGIDYSDPVAPEIKGVRLYPRQGDPVDVAASEISLPTPFYAGIYAVDKCEAASGKNGPDRIELFVDDTLFFRYRAASFLFEESRNVNAIIDYPHYQRTREYYIITRQLPGLRNPNHVANSHGWITFHDTLPHRLTYYVYDEKGNRSRKSFTVRSAGEAPRTAAPSSADPTIAYRQGGLVRNGGSRLSIPPFALYADDHLAATRRADSRFLSDVYGYAPQLYPMPPHVACTLRISKPETCSDYSKVVIVHVQGTKYSACATRMDHDCYTAQVKEFGDYALVQDLKAPAVRPSNFKEGQNVASLSELRLRVTDDLSGLHSYSCHVDGKWQLAEYDGKTATLSLSTTLVPSGTHTLRVTAVDAVGNTTEREWTIRK